MRARHRGLKVGFMVLWLVFWASAMFVAVWLLGGLVLAGEPELAIFLAVWLAAAGFGLLQGGRRLLALFAGDQPVSRRPVRQAWRDDMPEER